ncbi:MAG: M1 family peptidase, partial [Sphingomonadales bacterium]|nr:M1 family peptidase [Sphingomonadales bacterium]
MSQFRSVSAALLAATALTFLAGPALAQDRDTVDTSVPTQLPRTAVPHHYAIQTVPYADRLIHSGSVRISLEVVKATSALVLNAADLDIKTATLYDAANRRIDGQVALDADAQTATFDFGETLAPGDYTLDVTYLGTINTQANGLFALDYKNPAGADKRALFTQFEAPDARRFVPSWDEPDYKATFDLTATVPADQMAVSNMPIATSQDLAGGLKRVSFDTSPIMSSYLLFFGTGEFGRITKMAGDTEVGIVMGKGNEEKARYALDAEAEVLNYFNDYFGTPYPLPKLDNVAGPGQSQFFSAMENWGAIFTFERILLNDPAITTESERHAIFSVQAHEIAHQWFGDLVTMAWWDDLWLNEGFASWMENKTTQTLRPEWGADIDSVSSREAAMGQDAYATTHPIVQTIRTVEQTNQAFDGITYSKGESVIGMLEDYAGADVWQRGIQAYIAKHQYRNTRTDDLWEAIEGAGAAGLTRIAHDFTLQPGIPLITVNSAQCVAGNTELVLDQSEFSRDRRAETAASPQSWHVPIAASTGGATVKKITDGRETAMTVPGCGPLLINKGQQGYFRTDYQPAQLAALTAAFAGLDPVDQYGLLNNEYSLSLGGYQPMGEALDLYAAIPSDANRKVLGEGLGTIYGLYSMFDDNPAAQAKLGAMIDTTYAPVLDQIGLVPRAGEPVMDTTLRPTLIAILGAVGSARVNDEAARLFAALASNPDAIDGSLKRTWLSLIARKASAADWDKIHAMAKAATGSVERSSLYQLLGAAEDEALASKTLALALTPEPGATISATMIGSVAGQHPELALDFVLAHLDEVSQLIDKSAQSRAVAGIGSGSDQEATIAKLEAYAAEHLEPGARKPVE